MTAQTQTSTLTLEERIANIREKWFLVDPAYFMTLCTHRLEINPAMKCPIACGGGYLYVHPTYYNDKSDKFLEESLKIEIIRILLKHPYQRQLSNPVKMLLASNMTIGNNTSFADVKLTTSQQAFKTSQYDRESMEALYSLIKIPELSNVGSKGKNKQKGQGGNQNSQGQAGNGGSGSGSSGSSQNSSGSSSKNNQNSNKNSNGNNNSDSSNNNNNQHDPLNNYDDGCSSTDDALERTQFWKEDEFYYETVNNLIGKIENNNANGNQWGSMPGNIVDEIKKALIPKFDYKSVFRRVRSTIPSSKRSLTRMKPNRRFGYDSMGSKRECTTKILVAIDTSGSISDKELELALGFIRGFFKTNIDSIWSIQWDTKVYPESFKELTKKTVISKGNKVWGRGGTDASCVIEALQDKGKKGFLRKEKFNLVIFVTDGYFSDIPLKYLKTNYNRTKFLFCLNNKQNYENFKKNTHMAKFGPCSFVDEKID